MSATTSTVLIACDTSEHSEHCVRFYFDRLHKPGNHVEILHVEDYYTNAEHDLSPKTWDEVKEEARAVTLDLKQKIEAMAEQAGHADVEFLIHHGKDVWHTIIEVAEERRADMIVMGSRGRGVLRRTLIGSVCDSVVHHAHIPVLVIRDEKKHKRGKHH